MARRQVNPPPKTFVAETRIPHTWYAHQTYEDCIKLIFGTGSDAHLFWNGGSWQLGGPCDDVCCGGNIGINLLGTVNITANNAGAAICYVLDLTKNRTTCVVAGHGVGLRFFAETTAGAQNVVRISGLWTTVTDASRVGDFLVDASKCQVVTNILRWTGATSTWSFGTTNYIKIPSFTDCNRGCPGNAGNLIFNTTTNTLNYDNGTNWICVNNGCTT